MIYLLLDFLGVMGMGFVVFTPYKLKQIVIVCSKLFNCCNVAERKKYVLKYEKPNTYIECNTVLALLMLTLVC